MTERAFSADLNFLENCNYNASTTSKEVTLSLQTPMVTVQKLGNNFYYGDTVEVFALITYGNNNVTNGVVDFYYINLDDPQAIEHKINDQSVQVDVHGNARVKFIPYRDCKVIAKYDGDPYFGIASSEDNDAPKCEIHLIGIPTKLEFKNTPPYFVNPNDDIKLDVVVNDIRDPEHPVPIDYGIVTFLYYCIYDIDHPWSGQERVIGNPAYLIDGEASINYVPIQRKDENNNLYNVEFIKAVYNYSNNLYGVDWHKYYNMHSACNSIAILQPNTINISMTKNNGGTFEPLDIENGVYVATNEDAIRVNFEIPGYTFSNDATLKVCIKGIDAPLYATYDGTKFKYDITNMDAGLYYVYAVATDDQGSYLKTEDGEHITVTNINNVDYDINDSIYLQSTESQRLYFQIEAKESEYNIAFTNAENYVLLDNVAPLKLRVNLDAPNDPCFNSLLKGEKCYFYCSTLEQTYNSTIKESNGQLYAELEIINNSLEYNVPVQLVNDYVFYAYINTATYTKQCNNTTVSHQYTKHNSQPIIIKTRNNPTLELSVSTVNGVYPGKMKYAIVGNNIYKETIPVNLMVNNELIQALEISQQNNVLTGYISNLLPGTYTIQAIGQKAPYTIQSNVVSNRTIDKSSLSLSSNVYNNEIITNRYATVIFGLEESTLSKINVNDFNTNNFTATITKDNITNDITNIELIQLTDQYINFVGNVNLCDDGIWNTSLSYTGNDKYYSLSDTFEINAVRYEASCSYQKNDDDIICQLSSSSEGIQHNGEYVLIVATFINANEDEIKIINITDSNGVCVFANPLNSALDWQQYENVRIEIDPHKNIFANAANETNAVTTFKTYCSNANIQCSDNDIVNLYRQFVNNKKMSLFVGYDQTTDEQSITEISDEEPEWTYTP